MNDKLTKPQLYKIISATIGISLNKSKEILNIILSNISETLGQEECVTIQRFGKFFVTPPKTRQIYNIKTQKVEVTNIKPTVSFKASKCLVGELNKKKSEYKQTELFIDSDNCRVIKSKPNQEQTDSLQIGYDPTLIKPNRKNYTIVYYCCPKRMLFSNYLEMEGLILEVLRRMTSCNLYVKVI